MSQVIIGIGVVSLLWGILLVGGINLPQLFGLTPRAFLNFAIAMFLLAISISCLNLRRIR